MRGVLNNLDIDKYFWRAKRGIPPCFLKERASVLECWRYKKYGKWECASAGICGRCEEA